MTSPTVVSLRDLYLAVQTRLGSVGATVFVTEAKDVPMLANSDGLAAPYVVLHPAAGDPGVETNLCDTSVHLAWAFQVTCAAGLTEDLLALVDRVNTALFRWVPVVDGLICGQLHVPIGYQAPILLDRSTSPHRPYVPLQFTSLITAA